MNTIEQAIDVIAQGGMIIVVDDADRENEGDLIVAAELVTPAIVNFMARYARGLICLPMMGKQLDNLRIPMQHSNRKDPLATAFTISIDAAEGITTGISAADRARTINMVCDDMTGADDISMPGHIFPLRARDGGVLERPGHTEAAVDFARLAGCKPAAAICEIMNEDGTMMRYPELQVFAAEHDLPLVSIKDLITYRRQHDLVPFPRHNLQEKALQLQAQATLPTQMGDFELFAFVDRHNGDEHVALVKGDPKKGGAPLVRIHSECLTGDVFNSKRCDCGSQLEVAMKAISEESCGMIIYLRQEGRGIGLINKVKAYHLQEKGWDTVEANEQLGFVADLRDYQPAIEMLNFFKVKSFRLLTNNPQKLTAVKQFWGEQVTRVAIHAGHCPENQRYLQTKKDKLEHMP